MKKIIKEKRIILNDLTITKWKIYEKRWKFYETILDVLLMIPPFLFIFGKGLICVIGFGFISITILWFLVVRRVIRFRNKVIREGIEENIPIPVFNL